MTLGTAEGLGQDSVETPAGGRGSGLVCLFVCRQNGRASETESTDQQHREESYAVRVEGEGFTQSTGQRNV